MNLADFAVQATESHDIRHFILFLENNDGNAYNLLMRDLSSIYSSVHNDAEFLAAGAFRASLFVRENFSHFHAKYAKDKRSFYVWRNEIIAYVATALVNSEIVEFKLGNLCTA